MASDDQGIPGELKVKWNRWKDLQPWEKGCPTNDQSFVWVSKISVIINTDNFLKDSVFLNLQQESSRKEYKGSIKIQRLNKGCWISPSYYWFGCWGFGLRTLHNINQTSIKCWDDTSRQLFCIGVVGQSSDIFKKWREQ